MEERHLQPPDTFPGPWALNTQKMRSATNAFFMYLEPKERVWWLQMSSYFYYTKSKN